MKDLNWGSEGEDSLKDLGFASYHKSVSSRQANEDRQAHRAAKIHVLALPPSSIMLKFQNYFVTA